jgi:hypothetical protein
LFFRDRDTVGGKLVRYEIRDDFVRDKIVWHSVAGYPAGNYVSEFFEVGLESEATNTTLGLD